MGLDGSRFRVLITAPYFQPVVDEYRDRFEEYGIEPVVHEVEERASEDELLRIIEGVDGIICGDDRFTRAVVEAADRLKVISKWGTGIDSIDREACREHDIAVCNTPDAFSHPVADTVLGYMLTFARNIPWMDRHMKAGGWKKLPGVSLRESTVGIVGVGDVGRRVAERVAAFGAVLVGNDIRPIEEEVLATTGMSSVQLAELLERSDFVSLNCDLNETSRGLIDGEALKAMKSDSVLINTARGPVVDEGALVDALREGAIRGAGLDVFEVEPLPEDSPLRDLDNVLLASHNANASPEAWARVHESTFRNLVRELEKRGER